MVEGSAEAGSKPAPQKKRKKKKRRTKIYVWKLIDEDVEKWRPESSAQYTISKATPSHRTFVVVRNVLSPEEIMLLGEMPKHPSAKDCNDRHKKLNFQHQVSAPVFSWYMTVFDSFYAAFKWICS